MTQAATNRHAGRNASAQPPNDKPHPVHSARETPSAAASIAASEQTGGRAGLSDMLQAAGRLIGKNAHAALYGVVGFVLAALILIIGFWPTVLLALFAAAGILVGKYRDGDRATRELLRRLLRRL